MYKHLFLLLLIIGVLWLVFDQLWGSKRIEQWIRDMIDGQPTEGNAPLSSGRSYGRSYWGDHPNQGDWSGGVRV